MIAAYSAIGRDLDSLAQYLAPAERTRLETLGARRRGEHLVSRALTKYLYLNRDAISAETLHEVGLAEIERIPARQYRDVEIVRVSRDAAPVLSWRGVEQTDVRLSIAHADGYCVAALSDRHIGVDIASVEPRVPAFYRVQFSEQERAWASHDDALFTLLWSVKESLVKTGVVADPSLWGFDEIDVSIDAPAQNVATMYAGLNDRTLVSLAGRTTVANNESHHRIAFTRIAHSLFSFVTLEGVRSSHSGDVRVA